MVKKKMTDSERDKEDIHNESIENKDNKDIVPGGTEDLKEGLKDEMPEKQTLNQEVAPESISDKVVAGEMSFEEKLAEMQDKYLRISAEFDNYRRRTLREKMEISKYAGEELLQKILPVMDDFERALKHMDPSSDCKSIKDGIDLIYSKFLEFLKQQGVSEIESLNCDFNVDLHDAVAKFPVSEADKKGKVVEVLQKGYYLRDKVIRHSKVVVGE